MAFDWRKDMKWVCGVCGFEVEQDEKPDGGCPVCGADLEEAE